MVVMEPGKAPDYVPNKPPYFLVVMQGGNTITVSLQNNFYTFQPGMPCVLPMTLYDEVMRHNGAEGEEGLLYIVKKNLPAALSLEEFRSYVGWKPAKKEGTSLKEKVVDFVDGLTGDKPKGKKGKK